MCFISQKILETASERSLDIYTIFCLYGRAMKLPNYSTFETKEKWFIPSWSDTEETVCHCSYVKTQLTSFGLAIMDTNIRRLVLRKLHLDVPLVFCVQTSTIKCFGNSIIFFFLLSRKEYLSYCNILNLGNSADFLPKQAVFWLSWSWNINIFDARLNTFYYYANLTFLMKHLYWS